MKTARLWLLVLVPALIVASILSWLYVGFLAGIEHVFADEAPAAPPASELPLPAGFSVVSDKKCTGSHCSTRDLALDGPAMSAEEYCQTFTSALNATGWSLEDDRSGYSGCYSYDGGDRLAISARRDGMYASFDWPAQQAGDPPALGAGTGFASDEAGKAYWSAGNSNVVPFAVALTATAVVASGVLYRVRRRPSP